MKKSTTVKLVFTNDPDGTNVNAFLQKINCASNRFVVEEITNHAFDGGRADLRGDDGKMYDYCPRMESFGSEPLPWRAYRFVEIW
jgi:hypothetical protein